MARRRYVPRRRYYPRRWYGRRRRRGSLKIPLAATAGIAGTLLGGKGAGENTTLSHLMAGRFPEAAERLIANVTGYYITDGTWDYRRLNLEPMLAGVVVSMLASKLGINKRLSKIPYVKL